jgi:hypothetical protein
MKIRREQWNLFKQELVHEYSTAWKQSKAFIADIELGRRATAVGVYHFVTGALYLSVALVAGALWAVSPNYAFALAAIFSLIAVASFVALRPV